jgi:hypothetical protein
MNLSKLTIIRSIGDYVSPKGQKDTQWECLCDCGKVVVVRQSRLRSKTRPTLSCGCLRGRRSGDNHPSITHGESRTRLYSIWHGMKDRCNNSYNDKNKDYHGKGIKVCKEWSDSFESFRNWALGVGYNDTLTIDRLDSNGDYEPNNCRFTSMKIQQNNRSNNKLISAWGETKTMADWLRDERCLVGRETLKTRLKTWDSVEDSIGTSPTKSFTGNQHFKL